MFCCTSESFLWIISNILAPMPQNNWKIITFESDFEAGKLVSSLNQNNGCLAKPGSEAVNHSKCTLWVWLHCLHMSVHMAYEGITSFLGHKKMTSMTKKLKLQSDLFTVLWITLCCLTMPILEEMPQGSSLNTAEHGLQHGCVFTFEKVGQSSPDASQRLKC